MQLTKLKKILEAVLLGADRTLTVIQMESLFELDEERPTRDEIRQALHEMAEDYEERGYELKQVASGFRMQVRQEYATWVGRLWEERPARYTRALLETMALIAYRQPITRGEIEEVRGVSVSSNIIKTLLERDWIKVLGHKDVPGKPSLYGTTKEFLDYFNLKSLDQLPTLAEIKDLDNISPELALDDTNDGDQGGTDNNVADGQSDSNQSDGDLSDDLSEDEQNNMDQDDDVSSPVEDVQEEQSRSVQAIEEQSSTESAPVEQLVEELHPQDIQADNKPVEQDQDERSDAVVEEEKQVFNV